MKLNTNIIFNILKKNYFFFCNIYFLNRVYIKFLKDLLLKLNLFNFIFFSNFDSSFLFFGSKVNLFINFKKILVIYSKNFYLLRYFYNNIYLKNIYNIKKLFKIIFLNITGNKLFLNNLSIDAERGNIVDIFFNKEKFKKKLFIKFLLKRTIYFNIIIFNLLYYLPNRICLIIFNLFKFNLYYK